MERFIRGGPFQLVQGCEAVSKLRLPRRRFDRALLLGMGGSALSGGIIELLRSTQRRRWGWDAVRDYRLPFDLDRHCLVFALSYSGDTEETLAAFEEASRSEAFVVAVSSGGRLQARAAEAGVPWLAIPPQPEGFQPRFALYFMLAILHEVLCRGGLLSSARPLARIVSDLDRLDGEQECAARELAAWIGGRIPVIYTSTAYEQAVARTWRIKFNENVKIPALAGAIPESNHNELIAFPPAFANDYAFLLMPELDGDPGVGERFALFGRLMESYGYGVRMLPLAGPDPLTRCLASLKLADWVTLYVARNRGTDPVSIPAIQDFKRLLAESRR
jgi:glucose/mannose-6-phosphate isomerase